MLHTIVHQRIQAAVSIRLNCSCALFIVIAKHSSLGSCLLFILNGNDDSDGVKSILGINPVVDALLNRYSKGCGIAQLEARKKICSREGYIGVLSYCVHRHAKRPVDENHKKVVRGKCRKYDLVYVRVLKESRVRQPYTYAYMHVREPYST